MKHEKDFDIYRSESVIGLGVIERVSTEIDEGPKKIMKRTVLQERYVLPVQPEVPMVLRAKHTVYNYENDVKRVFNLLPPGYYGQRV